MYETRKNRYSTCVSLCSIFLKPSDNSSLLFRLFTEKEPVMGTKAVSVSVHENKAAVLVHPDLSDYQWAEPKTFFIISPGSVNLGCLVCFKEKLRHIIWVCTSVNYYSNSLYVY